MAKPPSTRTPASPLPESPVSGTFLSQSALLRRGWTDTMVRALLKNPDLVVPHHVYGRSATIKLYRLARVRDAESSEAFRRAKAIAQRRSDAALKGHQAKKRAT